MRKAAGDEIVLVRLIEDGDVPDDVLGFDAQQAVEKMIKAVLVHNDVSLPEPALHRQETLALVKQTRNWAAEQFGDS